MVKVSLSNGLGLVAALAVSITALYVLGQLRKSSKKNHVNGKGSDEICQRVLAGVQDGDLEVDGNHLAIKGCHANRVNADLYLHAEPDRGQRRMRESLQSGSDKDSINFLRDEASTSCRNPGEMLERLGKSTDNQSSQVPGVESPRGPANSPPKFAVVGSYATSGGSGGSKFSERQKKKVRFSATVVEPSANNHDYRRRVRADLLHPPRSNRTAHNTSATSSTIALERSKLHSQAAHTISYNRDRFAHRANHSAHM